MLPCVLPSIPAAEQPLLNQFLELDTDIHALAARTRKPLADLITWAASASVQAYVDAYRDLCNTSRHLKQHFRLGKVVKDLGDLADACTDPIEKRRLLTALIRAAAHILRPPPRLRDEPFDHAPPPAPREPQRRHPTTKPPAMPEPAPAAPMHSAAPIPIDPLAHLAAADFFSDPLPTITPNKSKKPSHRSPTALFATAGAPPPF